MKKDKKYGHLVRQRWFRSGCQSGSQALCSMESRDGLRMNRSSGHLHPASALDGLNGLGEITGSCGEICWCFRNVIHYYYFLLTRMYTLLEAGIQHLTRVASLCSLR